MKIAHNVSTMLTKYTDNKLAEELDLIVLLREQNGFPTGTLGMLTKSYTRSDLPLYGEFACADGTLKEKAIALDAFRVLNVKNKVDRSIVVRYMQETRKAAL